MRPRLVVLVGPTGVGKTELSLSLAEFLHSPVINADSRQLFRDLPVGTAAPSAEQRRRVRHYFVGTLGLTDYYSAARYEADVLGLLDRLFARSPRALLTGGSMMYVDAVCKGIDDIPTVDEETRRFMLERYEEEGLERLCEELKLLDPDYYRVADRKNPKRVIHALEICHMTGKPYSSFRTGRPKARPFDILKIGLRREREDLYGRIDRRTERMIADGLVDEARNVMAYRHVNALNTVGYKEIFRYLDGSWTLETAVEKIKRNTRVYSRKQMAWLRRDESIHWFHPDEADAIKKLIGKAVMP